MRIQHEIRRRIFQISILAAGLVATLGGLSAQAEVTFAFQPEEGATYRFKLITEQDMTMSSMGQATNTEMRMEMTMAQKVLEVQPDQNVKVEYLYEDVKASGKTEVPGHGEMGSEAFEGIGAMLKGVTMTATMTPRGEIVEVGGMEEVMAQTAPGMGLDADALKQNVQQMSFHFPEGPVEVGESWDFVQEINFGYPLKTEITYTLKEVSGGVATIAHTGTMKTGENAKQEMGAMTMTFEMNGTMEGWTKVEVETGIPVSSEVDYRVEGKSVMTGGPEGHNFEMPMEMDGKVTMERL